MAIPGGNALMAMMGNMEPARGIDGQGGELARVTLVRNDLDGFGQVLHANWIEKRRLASGITRPCIDEWYETARAHGAIGGKILGAGGGGFLLLYAPVNHHREICQALPELRPIPFRFEPQGSKLIYIEENGYGQ